MALEQSFQKPYRARQWLIDFTGCDLVLLTKPARIRELALEAVRRGGASAITDQFHHADTVTGTVIMPSGRLTLHAWPSEGLLTLDLVDTVSESEESGMLDFGGVVEFMRDMFRASDMTKTELVRGESRSGVASDFADFQTEGAWLQ